VGEAGSFGGGMAISRSAVLNTGVC